MHVVETNLITTAAYVITYFHFNSDLIQLYLSTKMDWFSYKGIAIWCMCMGIHILKHLKEELILAIDKWLWMISNKAS